MNCEQCGEPQEETWTCCPYCGADIEAPLVSISQEVPSTPFIHPTLVPAPPMQEQASLKLMQHVHQISIGLLNLSGLGLGYLFLRRWLRWGLHFLVTAGLLVAFYAITTGQYVPLAYWFALFAVWLLWMVFDGWRLVHNQTSGNRYPVAKHRTFQIAVSWELECLYLINTMYPRSSPSFDYLAIQIF